MIGKEKNDDQPDQTDESNTSSAALNDNDENKVVGKNIQNTTSSLNDESDHNNTQPSNKVEQVEDLPAGSEKIEQKELCIFAPKMNTHTHAT